MRQLFLPACVCLVTWSGSTNPEARFTLDEFTGTSVARASIRGAIPAETTGIAPRDDVSEKRRSAEIKIPEEAVQDEALPLEAFATEPLPEQSVTLTPVPEAKSVDDALASLAIEFPVPSGAVVNNGIPAGIPLPPIAKPVVLRSTEEICDTLEKSAQINNLPAPFFIRLLFQESGFKPGVVSAAGAQGIAQFMPDTAEGMGVGNPFDPREAIPASARLLSTLVRQFGNLGLAAAAYNAGPKRIVDWLNSKGKGRLPDETQGYVKTITGKPVENWTSAEAKHPGAKLPKRAPCQESAGLLAWNGPDTVPMPQPSPVRAAPEKRDDKAIIVAAVRADMMHADRAERLADAAQSVAKTVAKTVSAKQAAIKIAAKQIAAARAATKPVAKVDVKIAAKVEPKADAKADLKMDAKASIKPTGKRRIKTAEADDKTADPGDTKPQKIAQQ